MFRVPAASATGDLPLTLFLATGAAATIPADSRTRIKLVCHLDGSYGGVECPEVGGDPGDGGGGAEQ